MRKALLTGVRLSRQGRSGGDQQAAGRPHPVHPRPLCDDGLRADRGLAGRAVPDPDPLHRMSLPYHIGNGWFGGFLPTTAFAMVAATGDIYYGLWYPIAVAATDRRHRPALPARDQGGARWTADGALRPVGADSKGNRAPPTRVARPDSLFHSWRAPACPIFPAMQCPTRPEAQLEQSDSSDEGRREPDPEGKGRQAGDQRRRSCPRQPEDRDRGRRGPDRRRGGRRGDSGGARPRPARPAELRSTGTKKKKS